MAAHTSRSDSASELASSAVMDGAGLIGDSIGEVDTQCITTAGTTPGATRFIIGAISTEEQARAEALTVPAAELLLAPTQGTGHPTGPAAGAAESTTVPARRPGLSTETPRLLEDTPNPVVRAASARGPSAATTMADRQGAIRHAEAAASVVEARVAAGADLAVAGVGNRSCVMVRVDR